jgi:PAS domain S-box-containing protein
VSLIESLTTGPGVFIYHLLVLLALEAMAGIALIEWRHTRNPDLRRILLVFGGMLALRLPLLLGGWLGPAILAPLLSGVEAVSLVLLGWAFIAPVLDHRVRRWYLPGGLAVILTFTVIFTLMWSGELSRSPALSYSASWQQPFWQAVSALLAMMPALFLLRQPQQERQFLPVLGFQILFLGFAKSCLGSLLLVMGQSDVFAYVVAGVGRFVSLLGYPLFTVAVYRTALQDMWAYRQELQSMSEEALRQTRELHFLVEVSRALGETLDLDAVLHQVVESIAMVMDADRCAIFLSRSDDPETVTLAAQYAPLQRTGRPAGHLAIPLTEQPTLGYVLQRRKQLTLNVGVGNPRLQVLYRLLGGQEAGPTIVQPLLRQRQILGVLVVGNDHSQRDFRPSEGRLCESIAVQVAAALENARLYRDLTAQARQLSLLLQSREEEIGREAAILESIAEGVIVSDRRGRVTNINAAAEHILGMPRQRIEGHSLERLAGHMALDPQADWRSISQADIPVQAVFELEDRVVGVDAAPVLTPAGDKLGVVAVLRDVTTETEAERAKSKFITAISHELRTPLTAIRGYAESLISGTGGPVSEAQSHFLKVIRDSALRMVSLADNLMAVAQIERGFVKLEYGETDVASIVDDVLHSFQGQLEARQMEVKLEIAGDLQPIEADPARVRQILDNLVSNAIKFTYPGGRVTIGAHKLREGDEETPEHYALWVEDTGIGISPDEQAHIWERFSRPAGDSSVEVSGLGVGLSIVRSLVEAHGGRVWLESTLGVGSKFTVLLPIERAQPIGG